MSIASGSRFLVPFFLFAGAAFPQLIPVGQPIPRTGKLPVPNFSAGGIATPADAALVRQLGAEAVFVGSGIFMHDSVTFAPPAEAARRARAIVQATTHFDDPKVLLEVSQDLGGAMKGLAIAAMTEAEMLQKRGW